MGRSGRPPFGNPRAGLAEARVGATLPGIPPKPHRRLAVAGGAGSPSPHFSMSHALLIRRRAEHDMAGRVSGMRVAAPERLFTLFAVSMPRLLSSLATLKQARCSLGRFTASSSRDFHLLCSTRSSLACSSFTEFFTRRVTRIRFASCWSPKPMNQWPNRRSRRTASPRSRSTVGGNLGGPSALHRACRASVSFALGGITHRTHHATTRHCYSNPAQSVRE